MATRGKRGVVRQGGARKNHNSSACVAVCNLTVNIIQNVCSARPFQHASAHEHASVLLAASTQPYCIQARALQRCPISTRPHKRSKSRGGQRGARAAHCPLRADLGTHVAHIFGRDHLHVFF